MALTAAKIELDLKLIEWSQKRVAERYGARRPMGATLIDEGINDTTLIDLLAHALQEHVIDKAVKGAEVEARK